MYFLLRIQSSLIGIKVNVNWAENFKIFPNWFSLNLWEKKHVSLCHLPFGFILFVNNSLYYDDEYSNFGFGLKQWKYFFSFLKETVIAHIKASNRIHHFRLRLKVPSLVGYNKQYQKRTNHFIDSESWQMIQTSFRRNISHSQIFLIF